MVALRYLWSRRSEAFITIITIISIAGVAIGVMVLNMVMAIMTGFEHELREKIIGANSHIIVRSLDGTIERWQEVSERLADLPGVESVAPYTYHQALLRAEGQSTGVLVRGIPAGSAAEAQLLEYLRAPGGSGVADERLFERGQGAEDEPDLPPIYVGVELQRQLQLMIGDLVSLLSPNVTSTPFGLVPRYRRFRVAGIYSSGLVEYESSLVYTSLEAGQRFFELGSAVSGIEVRVRNIERAPQVAANMQQVFRALHAPLFAQDWTITNKPLWDALRLEKKVYFIVLLLIVVMASFSIITTLIMIVLEKRRDIAVMRTMGASIGSIARIFRIQGSVIGLIGMLTGTLLGYLGCIALREYGFPLDQKIFPVATVPVRMNPVNFGIVGISAFAICFLATLYPARRASRVDPGTALRYE